MSLSPHAKKKSRQLITNGSVWFKNYKIEFWSGKRLTITKYGLMPDGWKTDRSNKLSSVTIDDTHSIFGGSFLSTLNRYKVPVTTEDMDRLTKGKEDRSTFDMDHIQEIIDYNNLECKYGLMLIEKLHQHLETAGIHTTDSYSPACYGKILFRKQNIKQTLDTRLDWNSPDKMKKQISRSAYNAFFGGRIEVGKYGSYYGDVYNYDLRSAYPSAMTDLPNLSRGRWDYRKNFQGKKWKRYSEIASDDPVKLLDPEHPFSLYHVRFNFPDDMQFYPFPFRTDTGAIMFPNQGIGWYWFPEVLSALDYGNLPPGSIEILEAYYFIEEDPSDRPFSYVRDVYAQRRKWEEDGNDAQMVLKLALNSSYGVLAMQEGAARIYKKVKGKWTARKLRPTYHQIEYAGYITSVTRAKIWSAITQDPESVITIATDGFYATKPFRLETGENLGQWEFTRYDGIQLIMSGVYRLLKYKDKVLKEAGMEHDDIIMIDGHEFYASDTIFVEDEDSESFYDQYQGDFIPEDSFYEYYGRGFGNKLLNWRKVNEGWQTNQHEVQLETNPQFVGMRFALIGDRWGLRNRWIPKVKTLTIDASGKRLDPKGPPKWTKTDNPSLRLYETKPYCLGQSRFTESGEYKPRYLKWNDGQKETDEQIYEREIEEVLETERLLTQ